MTRTRISLLLGVVGAMALVSCSSDKPSSSTSGATNPTTEGSVESTTTLATGGAPSTAAPTDAASTSTSGVAVDASSTTVASRVVTDPSDNVRTGDSGEGVRQIQFTLVANGYKLPVDGQFGPVTETAVRAFQKKHGLTIDGVVGPITWARLQSTIGATTTTDPNATTTTAETGASSTTT